jgi:hypothetical protein
VASNEKEIFMRVALWPALMLTIAAISLSVRAEEEDEAVDNTIVPAVDTLPAFTLKDPLGTAHTNAEFAGKKIVFVVTVPTQKQGGVQKKWVEQIKTMGTAGKDFYLIMVQDMTQSGNPEMVMDHLKKKWKPGGQTMILVDDRAELRSSLEAARGLLTDRTSVLVYDEKGRLTFFDRRPAGADGFKRLQAALGK